MIGGSDSFYQMDTETLRSIVVSVIRFHNSSRIDIPPKNQDTLPPSALKLAVAVSELSEDVEDDLWL
jgi:hypothetical protein